MNESIVFIDTEVGRDNHAIYQIGALREGRADFHSSSLVEFFRYIQGAELICGHNILQHDLPCLQKAAPDAAITAAPVDTLYLSPLLFPEKTHHALAKDEKLQDAELSNPVNDCRKAKALLYEEVNAFAALPSKLKRIFCALLYAHKEFQGFFQLVGFKPYAGQLAQPIRETFRGQICESAPIEALVQEQPVELAYALALIHGGEGCAQPGPWLRAAYPKTTHVLRALRAVPCHSASCAYCQSELSVTAALQRYFGYPSFRTYGGRPLQQEAAQAAVDGASLLAVFPTGGGKSITFQLPALMAGRAEHGLTVVISPLQSLMKDQVDNLNEKGITEAVTVNGLLNPVERASALQRVADGSASLLYISPEQLRSRTIERILSGRTVSRFVIDEAHCFSAWGQDFRVDYLYIGDFIRRMQEIQGPGVTIPVSCFTATAKQKVIEDISAYFKDKLGITLQLFAADSMRENLHYTVLKMQSEEEKYTALRRLLEEKRCPTIVYVSRTRRTRELAERLTRDGFAALPFNGKMEAAAKIENQEAFIQNQAQVMVATSAFGMGVDKKDVKLVVHYEISSSLEDYMQEAGRAGRDPALEADCYVLYQEADLDQHFALLNQTKLSLREVQQVWRAIKQMTGRRDHVQCSALEIARQAGWDDTVADVETRVRTAIAALETAGYVKRGQNMPRVYATSILARNMQEAARRIDASPLFSKVQRVTAKRVVQSLISRRQAAAGQEDEAESRVDYLADRLGLPKEDVIGAINLMRQDGLLADAMDMTAYVPDKGFAGPRAVLESFAKLEAFVLSQLSEGGCEWNFKERNEQALAGGVSGSSVKKLRTLLYYHIVQHYVEKPEYAAAETVRLTPCEAPEALQRRYEGRLRLCRFIISALESLAAEADTPGGAGQTVTFSLVGLHKAYQNRPQADLFDDLPALADMEDALLYLARIGALRLEDGFLVIYQGMQIERLVMEPRVQYKAEDYKAFEEFYRQKVRQIHMVGRYAELMAQNPPAAQQFVQDYFHMDAGRFVAKYFKGESRKEIERGITPSRYRKLFGDLSAAQRQIIDDDTARCIAVAAGPGSGKTRVLVHKLAALLLLEDVKHEQLLMLTFSRAAATEFKQRLVELMGSAAYYVEVKTFHSYCFDLMGRVGSLEGAGDVVQRAVSMIRSGEVEPEKITKSVLVIDEAQDMDEHEFALVEALMQHNETMRVIAVGDDDQNIYAFRGSSAAYFRSLLTRHDAALYELTENFRSREPIVSLADALIRALPDRMKQDPITAVSSEAGVCEITRYQSRYMARAVADQVAETAGDGSACVLTSTNEEALQMQSLLLQRGMQVRLIQSLDGFSLGKLAEVRFFLQTIDRELSSPVISKALWERAKQALQKTYAQSACLENVMHLIHDFESVNPVKYRTDLDEFIKESRFEDSYHDEAGTVLVSTIHKAKGHEFSSVYMLLQGERAVEDRRALYVGLTRARNALYIHTNTELFTPYRSLPGLTWKENRARYGEPSELILPLMHQDVVLDFFKSKQSYIGQLRSGMPLHMDNAYLTASCGGRQVRAAKFSRACAEKLAALQERGYKPVEARVRFVLGWQPADEAGELEILIPTLYLKK